MNDKLIENARSYCSIVGTRLVTNPALGHGTDGSVWTTSRKTAVKAFNYEKNYLDEVKCYLRLKENNIRELDGLAVPTFEDCQDELLVVEMSIVQKPYLLDFGKVYIDEYPPYWNDNILMANWHEELNELFGENIDRVHAVLHSLKQLGIFYVDPKPANIRF